MLAPLRETGRRRVLGVGQRQVDDVVRAPSEEFLSLLRSDDVVGRRDERIERPRGRRVVAERAERPYDCHGTDRTNRAASLPPLRLVRATTGDPPFQARRLSCSNSIAKEARSPRLTTTTRCRTRALQRRRRFRFRFRSGVTRLRRATTSTFSCGTTAITADVGT